MTIQEEIPDTEFALRQYILYSKKQIKDSYSLITKLNNRVKACFDKCKKRGFEVDDLLEKKNE